LRRHGNESRLTASLEPWTTRGPEKYSRIGFAGQETSSQAFSQVNDVEAEVTELKARGVKFEEYDMPGVAMKNSIATAGGAKTAWFKDTEGNILAVSQRL